MTIFAYRAFRQRSFFVRRDSGLYDFQDLEGKCIGTNGWPDSGNTWSRAVMRAHGVNIQKIHWTVGLIGRDRHANGVEPNHKMIQALCDEELAQGLIEQPIDAANVFAEFEQAVHT